MPRRNDTEMGPANSLHAPAYYSEYNKRFDLIFGFDKVAFTRAIFNCDNWHFAVFLDYSCLFLSRFEKNGKMPILAAKFAHVNAA